MLTETDRKYLLGEIEYEDKQQQRNRRRYIRDRVRNGIIDFELLDMLEDRDRKQIFSEVDSSDTGSTGSGTGKSQIFAGMCALIKLLYIVSDENNILFEEMLKNGIRDAEAGLTGRQLERVRLEKEFKHDKGETTTSGEPNWIEMKMNISDEEEEIMREILENMMDSLDNNRDD